jgi:acetylxylan esterase
MVNYTLSKYSGDPARVFAMGGSSGAMMTNVLAGSYPDVFEAGAAFSGTAHACFAGAASATPATPNQTCQMGLEHTAADWGNFVHNSYPGYAGRRTRMMIFHGLADPLVRPQVSLNLVSIFCVFSEQSPRAALRAISALSFCIISLELQF